MTVPAGNSGHVKKPGIIDEIPKEVAVSLAEAGGIPWLCSLVPVETDLTARVKVHKALADPLRLKILYLLSAQPLCVCIIKHCLRIADSKLSYHLGILKEAGLIESRHEKNWLIYSLTDPGKAFVEREDPGSY